MMGRGGVAMKQIRCAAILNEVHQTVDGAVVELMEYVGGPDTLSGKK
jgi:hypothetical protein